MALVLSLLQEHAATALIILLGAAAAFASGRAIAQTWRPYWQLPLYMLLLAAVTRFCHFALFEATLLDAQGYVIDLAHQFQALARADELFQEFADRPAATFKTRWDDAGGDNGRFE